MRSAGESVSTGSMSSMNARTGNGYLFGGECPGGGLVKKKKCVESEGADSTRKGKEKSKKTGF